MAAFHEVRFPIYISRNSKSGPQRQTDVVTLRSGAEERNSIWANSRRKYNAGYGIKGIDDAQSVIAFWEERRGRLYSFRWKDYFDCRSSPAALPVSAFDQPIGTGDGTTATWQLAKTYGSDFAPWTRPIRKPVAGSVRVGVAEAVSIEGAAWSVDATSGLVTFKPGHIPPAGAAIMAGFEFDVPVRFDSDYLEFDMTSIDYGEFPNIPLIEIKP